MLIEIGVGVVARIRVGIHRPRLTRVGVVVTPRRPVVEARIIRGSPVVPLNGCAIASDVRIHIDRALSKKNQWGQHHAENQEKPFHGNLLFRMNVD